MTGRHFCPTPASSSLASVFTSVSSRCARRSASAKGARPICSASRAVARVASASLAAASAVARVLPAKRSRSAADGLQALSEVERSAQRCAGLPRRGEVALETGETSGFLPEALVERPAAGIGFGPSRLRRGEGRFGFDTPGFGCRQPGPQSGFIGFVARAATKLRFFRIEAGEHIGRVIERRCNRGRGPRPFPGCGVRVRQTAPWRGAPRRRAFRGQ